MTIISKLVVGQRWYISSQQKQSPVLFLAQAWILNERNTDNLFLSEHFAARFLSWSQQLSPSLPQEKFWDWTVLVRYNRWINGRLYYPVSQGGVDDHIYPTYYTSDWSSKELGREGVWNISSRNQAFSIGTPELPSTVLFFNLFEFLHKTRCQLESAWKERGCFKVIPAYQITVNIS